MGDKTDSKEVSVAETHDAFYEELRDGNSAADRRYKIRFLWVYFWKILFGDGATVLLYLLLPSIALSGELTTAAGRLVYALKWHLFPAVLFLVLSYVVIWTRGLLANWSAWDPYRSMRDGHEIDLVARHNRVIQNNIEGYIPFFILSMITAAYIEASSFFGLQLIPCLIVMWTLGRLLYWVGYLTQSWYRLPGVMLSFHISLYLAVYCGYRFFMG